MPFQPISTAFRGPFPLTPATMLPLPLEEPLHRFWETGQVVSFGLVERQRQPDDVIQLANLKGYVFLEVSAFLTESIVLHQAEEH